MTIKTHADKIGPHVKENILNL